VLTFIPGNIYTALANLLLLFCLPAFAQQEYIVYFTDKKHNSYTTAAPENFLSEKSIDRRLRQHIPVTEEDLPVSNLYLDSLRLEGIEVIYSSKWLNACLVQASPEQLSRISSCSFVRHIDAADKRYGGISRQESRHTLQPIHDYGTSEQQLQLHHIPQMHSEGLTGQGIVIAVLDAGFKNADKIGALQHLVDSDAILATYDFPSNEPNVYNDHEHGTHVLSIIAAYAPGTLIGAAFEAAYILLRTEDVSHESSKEEFYWLLAAELSDSLGADILTSSLGYNTFDNPAQNYSYEDMNGETTLITWAAEKAFSKGMLIVNSIGNEGNLPWRYLIAPADGHHVLAVGAVNRNGQFYSTSSRGPSADGRIKPDVVATGQGTLAISPAGNLVSVNGTSYSAPLISGFAANLWQHQPELTNLELLQKIKESGSQAANPDNNMGYGIPIYKRTTGIQASDKRTLLVSNPVTDFIYFFNLPFTSFTLTITDLSGKNVVNTTLTNTQSLDVSTLASGAYIVSIDKDDTVLRQIIIKK